MSHLAGVFLYGAAFLGVAVIPVFLWNLWLAPYRLMGERLDEAIKQKIVDVTCPQEWYHILC